MAARPTTCFRPSGGETPDLRTARGLLQEALAEKADLHHGTVLERPQADAHACFSRALVEIHRDPDVAQYLLGAVPATVSSDTAWRNVAMLVGHWHLRGVGVVGGRRATRAVIGRVGFWKPRIDERLSEADEDASSCALMSRLNRVGRVLPMARLALKPLGRFGPA